jgi:hypothetical protein
VVYSATVQCAVYDYTAYRVRYVVSVCVNSSPLACIVVLDSSARNCSSGSINA